MECLSQAVIWTSPEYCCNKIEMWQRGINLRHQSSLFALDTVGIQTKWIWGFIWDTSFEGTCDTRHYRLTHDFLKLYKNNCYISCVTKKANTFFYKNRKNTNEHWNKWKPSHETVNTYLQFDSKFLLDFTFNQIHPLLLQFMVFVMKLLLCFCQIFGDGFLQNTTHPLMKVRTFGEHLYK